MKKVGCCLSQLILLLIIVFVVAVPLAAIATATAPLHTPQIAESFICPPNTHLKSEWYQASWNHPGERTLSVTCMDEEGHVSSTLPQDANFWLTGIRIYLPYSFIPLFGIGAVALAALNLIGTAIGKFLRNISGPKTSHSLNHYPSPAGE